MRHISKELINYQRNLDSKVNQTFSYKINKAVETQIFQITGIKEINQLKNYKSKNHFNKMKDNNYLFRGNLKWINLLKLILIFNEIFIITI